MNIFDLTDTWNDGGTTFNAIKMNVTDTASAADSKLLDLQVGGVSQVSVGKFGMLTVSPGSIVSNTGGLNFRSNFALVSVSNVDFGLTRGNLCRIVLGDSGIGMLSNGVIGWTPSNSADASKDLTLQRDAANTLAQRNGTNPQEFRLYNTYTDASNYERGFAKWDTNIFEIGTGAAGTGTRRDIKLNGANRAGHIPDVSSGTDATYETAINAIIAALESHGIAATS